MFSAIMALSIGSLVSIFYRGEFFNFNLALGGAAVFSMYIVYDLQMIMGDKKLNISPDEYIFASFFHLRLGSAPPVPGGRPAGQALPAPLIPS